MKITDVGRKAVEEKGLRAWLLEIAYTQLILRRCPEDEFKDSMRFTLAQYLAAVPTKKGYRLPLSDGGELDGVDEFIKDQTETIEPIVNQLVADAYGMKTEEA